MELFLILVAFAIFAVYSSAKDHETWKSVAQDVDLTYTNPWLEGKKLRGARRGFDIAIDEITENKHTKVQVEVRSVDPGFTLGRDSAFQRMLKPDIETGDQLFDERTRIEGDPDWALALLGPEARRLAEIVISGWNGQLKGERSRRLVRRHPAHAIPSRHPPRSRSTTPPTGISRVAESAHGKSLSRSVPPRSAPGLSPARCLVRVQRRDPRDRRDIARLLVRRSQSRSESAAREVELGTKRSCRRGARRARDRRMERFVGPPVGARSARRVPVSTDRHCGACARSWSHWMHPQWSERQPSTA